MTKSPTLIQRGDTATENTLAELRPLAELTHLTAGANRGAPCDFSTLWRWATTGRRGVKLRAVRVGRKLCSTAQWLFEFFEALASAELTPTPPIQTPAKRTREFNRRQAAADAVLREAGVLAN